MSVDTDIKLQDFRDFGRFVAQQGNPFFRFIELLLFGAGCALLTNLLSSAFHVALDGRTMLITLVSFGSAIVLLIVLRVRRLVPQPGGIVLGRRRITISADGLQESSANHESLVRWPVVRQIKVTPTHIFVMLDRNAGLIIPRSSFATADECDRFVGELRKYAPAG